MVVWLPKLQAFHVDGDYSEPQFERYVVCISADRDFAMRLG